LQHQAFEPEAKGLGKGPHDHDPDVLAAGCSGSPLVFGSIAIR
jgi:hypothetical protein